MKEVQFSMEGIRNGYLFYQKWYLKGQGSGPRGGASPYKTLLSAPSPGGGGRGWKWQRAHTGLRWVIKRTHKLDASTGLRARSYQ